NIRIRLNNNQIYNDKYLHATHSMRFTLITLFLVAAYFKLLDLLYSILGILFLGP
ncbi:MAG: hypothetical protein ACJAXN_003120, partial [Psychromonas sp.]